LANKFSLSLSLSLSLSRVSEFAMKLKTSEEHKK